jgi:hypothetical protein
MRFVIAVVVFILAFEDVFDGLGWGVSILVGKHNGHDKVSKEQVRQTR